MQSFDYSAPAPIYPIMVLATHSERPKIPLRNSVESLYLVQVYCNVGTVADLLTGL